MAREKGGFWIGLAATVFYPLGWLTGRQRYQGREHLPETGGALLVGNHISHLDPVHTALFVHTAGRVPRFMAKNGLWNVPVLGSILRGSGQIPVFRDTADAQQSLAAGITALTGGKLVIIYPEGTITRDPDGWPMRSRTGVARMALAVLEAGVPVVPMVHWGTREVYDHYGRRFRPLPRTELVLRAGDPVDLSAYRGRTVDAAVLREVTDLIMGDVRALLAEVRSEPAPEEFFRPGGSGREAGR
ncbi:lysophospholipid acyltransferase family protein [Pseudonocardia sp. HH130630-07]|uniref:lysophospholipid acyltransferase family protein n=1 Tax=Pseudonocardia sp. HH130630-07 TaxID=1690815 RepID=UPI000814F46F|nr:lysophospholipid acyltransferase family protein [Pseudonocardia sp. HH130630-07]ANY05612.1 acyl-phosphate glycerol 3-phosphate acyltransferase [Pseudonocardia sp. HH130630-07]